MAKAKAQGSFASDLLSVSLYKPNQGRTVRQVTAIAVALVFVLGAYSLQQNVLAGMGRSTEYGIVTMISVVGIWLAFRGTNHAPFAEFLINVHDEMSKVSWPTWPELYRATIVVIALMFLLGFLLFGFDIVWQTVFHAVGFLRI